MELLLRLVISFVFGLALVKGNCDLSLFTEKDIVPKYISTIPQTELKVTYGDKSYDCGSKGNRTDVLLQPKLSYPANKDKYYTIIMFDPDAPLVSPYLHWLVHNVPGNDVDKGDTCAIYIPPSPPPCLRPHRYVCTVYEQKDKLKEGSEILNKLYRNLVRNNFNVKEFAKSCNLTGPTCGNFFYIGGESTELLDLFEDFFGK